MNFVKVDVDGLYHYANEILDIFSVQWLLFPVDGGDEVKSNVPQVRQSMADNRQKNGRDEIRPWHQDRESALPYCITPYLSPGSFMSQNVVRTRV